GSTNAGSLVIAAHMPGGEFGSGHFQEKDGRRAVQDVLDIRAGARAVRRPERIRSPPHDATVPCFPVRRSRYDRIDMIGGTPEREQGTIMFAARASGCGGEVARAGAARWTEWALRLTLATAFLSGVGDRLGAWGPHGSPHASWGDWHHFRMYADRLNWYM